MPGEAGMGDRVCLVTGATSGHGLALARGLCRLGARVILHGRDPARLGRAQALLAAETGNAPDTWRCDLASLDGVRRGAAELLDRGLPLHLLVNNAGLVNYRRQETGDGLEQTFAVNYLAAFQLTLRLLPRMLSSAPARVVVVSSEAHRVSRVDLGDLQLRRGYSWWRAYGRSKRAQLHFVRELDRRLQGRRVTVNAVDPGPVRSGIAANNGPLARALLAPLMRLFPAADRAAATALMLCTAPELGLVSGAYFRSGKRLRPGLGADPGQDRKLWRASAALAGVDFEG